MWYLSPIFSNHCKTCFLISCETRTMFHPLLFLCNCGKRGLIPCGWVLFPGSSWWPQMRAGTSARPCPPLTGSVCFVSLHLGFFSHLFLNACGGHRSLEKGSELLSYTYVSSWSLKFNRFRTKKKSTHTQKGKICKKIHSMLTGVITNQWDKGAILILFFLFFCMFKSGNNSVRRLNWFFHVICRARPLD